MKDKVLSMLRKKPMTDREITTELGVSIYYVRIALKDLLRDCHRKSLIAFHGF